MVVNSRVEIFEFIIFIINLLNFTNSSLRTKRFCEIEFGEKELCNTLKSMPNNKTRGIMDYAKSFLKHVGTN